MLKRAVIAVVDDDESVREAVAGLTKSLGHVALAFERAEDFLQSDRGRVAALIADVQMPGMTGPELHNRLVASGQPIPTILITAYPDLERSDFGLNRVGDSRMALVVIQTPCWVEVSRRCRSLFLKICATA